MKITIGRSSEEDSGSVRFELDNGLALSMRATSVNSKEDEVVCKINKENEKILMRFISNNLARSITE